jgi:hypothetical protein
MICTSPPNKLIVIFQVRINLMGLQVYLVLGEETLTTVLLGTNSGPSLAVLEESSQLGEAAGGRVSGGNRQLAEAV